MSAFPGRHRSVLAGRHRPAVAGRHSRASSQRGTRRAAAALLAFFLAGTAATVASVAPAAAHSVENSGGVFIPVGGLTYESGAGDETWGLVTHAAWSSRVVKHRYAVRTVYGYRSSATSDHGKGLAADFMVYSRTAKGDRIANFAKKHYKQLNVTYVIWYQRIWSVERASEGWRPMADAGSDTANHKDHVHISYRETPNDYTYQG